MKVKNIIVESYDMIFKSDEELRLEFNKYIDDQNEPLNIGGVMFTPSEALEKLSPERYASDFQIWKKDNGYIVDDMTQCACTCKDGECTCNCDGQECTCQNGECTCENIVFEEECDEEECEEDFLADMDIISSAYDVEVLLGSNKGEYYLKTGIDGDWKKTSAFDTEEALEIYDNIVNLKRAKLKAAKKANGTFNEFEDEIAQECNRIWESRQQTALKKKKLI
jgi:hypothetical protein